MRQEVRRSRSKYREKKAGTVTGVWMQNSKNNTDSRNDTSGRFIGD